MFRIEFETPAEKYFKKLKDKNLKENFFQALKRIATDPYIGSVKKCDLSGIYGYDVKYKGKNYEIAYLIREQKQGLVVILLAGTRENFYEELKRLCK